MKIVKEHILFEKFVEDSDPIADMKIGLLHRLEEIRKELDPVDETIWDEVDIDEDELILRLDVEDFYDVENFQSKNENYYEWEDIGVYEPFRWNYYIDIILSENKIIRSSNITNANIENFDYWDNKILCNNVLEKSDKEIAYIIDDDWRNYDILDAPEQAWEIAETEDEKEQERLSS